MRGWDRDPLVRRFERDAIVALGGIATVALVVRGGDPDAAVGVALGGLLVGASYGAIRGGVDLLLTRRAGAAGPEAGAGPAGVAEGAAAPRARGLRIAWRAAGFIGRYALLALAAYVMLTRFHAHPVGVLGGVTAPFLAAIAQLPRLWRQGRRPQ